MIAYNDNNKICFIEANKDDNDYYKNQPFSDIDYNNILKEAKSKKYIKLKRYSFSEYHL